MDAELDLFRKQLQIILDSVEDRLDADCAEVVLDFAVSLCAQRDIPSEDVLAIVESQYPNIA